MAHIVDNRREQTAAAALLPAASKGRVTSPYDPVTCAGCGKLTVPHKTVGEKCPGVAKGSKARTCAHCGYRNPPASDDANPNGLCYSCGEPLDDSVEKRFTPGPIEDDLRYAVAMAQSSIPSLAHTGFDKLVALVGLRRAAELTVDRSNT